LQINEFVDRFTFIDLGQDYNISNETFGKTQLKYERLDDGKIINSKEIIYTNPN